MARGGLMSKLKGLSHIEGRLITSGEKVQLGETLKLAVVARTTVDVETTMNRKYFSGLEFGGEHELKAFQGQRFWQRTHGVGEWSTSMDEVRGSPPLKRTGDGLSEGGKVLSVINVIEGPKVNTFQELVLVDASRTPTL